MDARSAHDLRERTLGRSWDSLAPQEVLVRDLYQPSLDDFIRLVGDPSQFEAASLLRSLALTDGEVVRTAGLLLFAEHPHAYVPSATVRLAKFVDLTTFAIAPIGLQGPLIRQIDDAFDWIMNNSQRVVIGDGIRTETRPLFPPDAVREMVVNALCHRDYRAPGPVQVRLYPDRLEIVNPGELPEGLEIAALFRPHASLPRNVTLANALSKAHVLDEVGTGTLRIKAATDAAGAPPPEFASADGTFTARLWTAHSVHPSLQRLSDRQEKVLQILKEEKSVPLSKILSRVSYSRGTLLAELNMLQYSGFVVLDGQGRAARWRLTDAWATYDFGRQS